MWNHKAMFQVYWNVKLVSINWLKILMALPKVRAYLGSRREFGAIAFMKIEMDCIWHRTNPIEDHALNNQQILHRFADQAEKYSYLRGYGAAHRGL